MPELPQAVAYQEIAPRLACAAEIDSVTNSQNDAEGKCGGDRECGSH